MKTLLSVLLLLLIAATASPNPALARSSNAKLGELAYLPVDPNLRVYFVTGMFSAEERKVLLDTMKAWQSFKRNRVAEISFADAGETRGLIDCHGCLTVVRQEILTSKPNRRFSFNALRHDGIGRLASAWIGLDRNTTAINELRTLMLSALDTGLGR